MRSVSRLRSQGAEVCAMEAASAQRNLASDGNSAGSGVRKSSTSTVAAKAKIPSLSASMRPTSPPAKESLRGLHPTTHRAGGWGASIQPVWAPLGELPNMCAQLRDAVAAARRGQQCLRKGCDTVLRRPSSARGRCVPLWLRGFHLVVFGQTHGVGEPPRRRASASSRGRRLEPMAGIDERKRVGARRGRAGSPRTSRRHEADFVLGHRRRSHSRACRPGSPRREDRRRSAPASGPACSKRAPECARSAR